MIRIILEIQNEDDMYLNLSRLIEDVLRQDKLKLPKFRYQSELITDSHREIGKDADDPLGNQMYSGKDDPLGRQML